MQKFGWKHQDKEMHDSKLKEEDKVSNMDNRFKQETYTKEFELKIIVHGYVSQQQSSLLIHMWPIFIL